MPKYCEVCGKEIPDSRRKYCSKECYAKANEQQTLERYFKNHSKKVFAEKKCPICGKTFTPVNKKQVYCDWKCRYEAEKEKIKVQRMINSVANRFDFDVNEKNRNKIANLKLQFFGKDNCHLCPCDGNNPNRYCGSPLCVKDTREKGHCHCNLFRLK